jgi:hypothetical protein
MAAVPNHVQWWRRALPGALAATPVALMLLVGLAVVPSLTRFTTSETARMMNLLGALRSKTVTAADNPFQRPEVRAAARGRHRRQLRRPHSQQRLLERRSRGGRSPPDYRPLAEEILNRYPDVSREQLTAAEAVLKEARERQRPSSPARPQQRRVAPVASSCPRLRQARSLLCSSSA